MPNKLSAAAVVVWFVLSAFLGFAIGQFIDPPALMVSAYGWVGPYISSFPKFCWSMLIFILSLPMVFGFIVKIGVPSICLPRVAVVAFIAIAISSFIGLLGLVEATGSNAYSRLVRLLMMKLDWYGALLFFYAQGYLIVISLVVLMNIDKRGKENV